ncbi:hypothetical protein PHYSODRAFT_340842 [Phytophthora sojae]|uniref:Uncharacterized protein n=1 Tax=Phytophthora sojae (strain P6497) TaxID=1094619 RepID=G5AB29_PHYSP|nr:hypothetical protein PHYSODRAFT_340842 [Phytophthora sojae]EGZ07808.1 hypothetical protein PHYSODRAFT_340842 [Phytophthora sojae]|eukprot:XP_009537374.1 hypothetical protein PHYSODRAFT_340842 [Phytophthora sojae]
MAPPSHAAAAALRALQCSGPGAVDVATDTSGRRPARQARSAGAPAPIAAAAVPPAPAAPAGDPTLIPTASGTSVDPPPAPPSSPESAAGATETPSPAVPSEEAPDSPPTPPPSASAPPSPTPAPSVTLATRGASVGGEAAVGGRAGAGAGPAEVPPTAVVLGEQQMLELARLVVGVAHSPPARVNAALDRSLQAATNVGEVLAAAVAPPRLPLAEVDELVALRRENDRLQAELSDAKDKLAEEMDLRTKSDYFLVSANSECDQALDLVQDMRSLEKRTLVAEADSAAAVRRNTQLHERISASLVTYNTQLERLRKQLADRDRANVIPARIHALTDENNSLRRANSILRRHSAAHGLDVDTLVLASAGISAAEIDWNLLGLSPPTVTVESPRHDESSSEEGEESKTTDVPMAESTEATSTPAASVGASAGSPVSTESSSRKRGRQTEFASVGNTAPQPPPHKRFGRPSVDPRARAAAAAAPSSPRSASGEISPPPRSMVRPPTTARSSWLESQPLPYEHSDVPLYPRLASRASPPSPAPAQQQESSDVEFGGDMSPSDTSQDDLEPGEIPEVSASAQGVQGSATEPSGTVIEVPSEVSPSAATSIPSPVSSGTAGVGRAPRESAAGVTEGSGGPPGRSPSGESPHESETSENRAALFLEMFGPDEREETSVAQPVAPSEAPSPLAAATGVPVASRAATVPLPSRLHTRSASAHAQAMVTATVTASPRDGPASIAPAVVDASDVARGSRKLSGLATLFLRPGFTVPGASECWHLIQNASVPLVFEDDLVAPSSVDGIVEFGLWTDPAHPFQVLRQLFPDEPCLIDTTGFPSSVAISRRATGQALLVRLWRQFQGGKAVKAYIDNLASILGQRNVQVLALRQAWSKYHRERSYRADRLRDQMLHKVWNGTITYDGQPPQHRTEVLLEPSYLQYSFEVMEWVPTTDDWASEVADVDAHEPWRNCWFQAPADHPYNTAFAPCNDVPLFVPNGSTRETVASSVVVESSLRTSMVVAPWVAEFANARRSRSPSPDEETKESGVASSAAGSSLGVLAQAVMEI